MEHKKVDMNGTWIVGEEIQNKENICNSSTFRFT